MNAVSALSRRAALSGGLALLGAIAVSSLLAEVGPPAAQAGSGLAPAARFDNVPVGIAVSRKGRIFLAFSRAIDENQPISVGEVVGGKAAPFPPGLDQDRGEPGPTRLLSVQALTVDARDRLWILDCGRIDNQDARPGTAKLVAVDLSSNKVVQTIPFPAAVAGATAFPNDVVIDLRRGKGGMAFLTDAAPKGPNGIFVVDLSTGTVTRRLNDHPSTKPAPGFVVHTEGQPVVFKSGPAAGQPLKLGADGIALSADGRKLFYAPISGHHWFRADADILADPSRPDADAARSVEDLGDRGFASDGLLGSAEGTIYVTNIENNAVEMRGPDGKMSTLVRDARLLWPDSMALAPDGTLYFTTTQIERGAPVRGTDQRVRPFTVWKIQTASKPLMLR